MSGDKRQLGIPITHFCLVDQQRRGDCPRFQTLSFFMDPTCRPQLMKARLTMAMSRAQETDTWRDRQADEVEPKKE